MDKIIKEYIDKYCKYCANRNKDICNITRDLKNNAKCVNYKEYSSKDKSSLITEIGRLQGKIEYLEEDYIFVPNDELDELEKYTIIIEEDKINHGFKIKTLKYNITKEKNEKAIKKLFKNLLEEEI